MIWEHPTPQEEALAKIDDYVRNHLPIHEERESTRIYFGGDKRRYGIRHLRLTAAVNRIRALSGKPPIDLL